MTRSGEIGTLIDGSHTLVRRLQVAFAAAQKAGSIVKDGWEVDHEVTEKGLGDLVCAIDIECDQVIQEEVLANDPEAIILSEELNPDIGDAKTFWSADPVDGSAAYLFKVSAEMPSTMLAHVSEGQTDLSVIHFPLTDELFWAARGVGAFKGIVTPVRLRCQQPDNLAEAWIEMNRNSDQRLQADSFTRLDERLRLPGGARLVTSNVPHSGLTARMVSGEKRLSAIVHDNNARTVKQGPWDVLPAALLLEEAGGTVASLDGKPYDPFQPKPFVMAASDKILRQLIDLA